MRKTAPNLRRGRPITRNRSHVLEMAMRAFWQADGAAVSVNSICLLSGVSKPSLYRDFGSEDGLTEAVLDRYIETVISSLLILLASKDKFASKIEGLIQFAADSPEFQNGCLFVKMRSTRLRFGEQTQKKIAELDSKLFESYVQFFEKSAAGGEWSGAISAGLAATYLQEQLALALTMRASGNNNQSVRDLLNLALSVLDC